MRAVPGTTLDRIVLGACNDLQPSFVTLVREAGLVVVLVDERQVLEIRVEHEALEDADRVVANLHEERRVHQREVVVGHG